MKIDLNQINEIAGLAQIELTPDETEEQRKDLERISAYTEKLAELDTTGLAARARPFGKTEAFGENRFRSDEVTNKDKTDVWTAAAPDSKGPYIRVPRTVED